MKYCLILVCLIVAANYTTTEAAGKEKKVSVFKRLFGGRDTYTKINDELLKRSKSDNVKDILDAASILLEESKGKRSSEFLTALKDLVALKNIAVPEIRYCSGEVQDLLVKNDANTGGLIYGASAPEDRYAKAVRDVVLERASHCQDSYPKKLEEVHLMSDEVDVLTAFQEFFVAPVTKSLKFLGLLRNFEVRVFKDESTKSTALLALEKISERFGDVRYKTAIYSRNQDEFSQLIFVARDWLIDPARKFLSTMPVKAFESAVMDARVAGKDRKFSWMNDKEFVENIETYLISKEVSKEDAYIYAAVTDNDGSS